MILLPICIIFNLIIIHYFRRTILLLLQKRQKVFQYQKELISYWLTIDASEETSITIDYSTTTDNTTLKTLVVLPDKTTAELKNGEDNTITLPQGKSEIAIAAFDAAGEVNVRFRNLTDAISVQKIK